MLPFGVIQIEQYRALQQKAAPLFLPEISRPQLPLVTRSSPGRNHPKLNRQIPELDHDVTLRKQTAETRSNRQKIQKCSCTFSTLISLSSAQNFAGFKPRNTVRSAREYEPFSQSVGVTPNRPARRLPGGPAVNVLSEGYDSPPHTSKQPALRLLGGLALNVFGDGFASHKCISTRFCSIYRMRRNLLKTNDRHISTRGHNHIPRSHEFRPISTKVGIEKP